MERTRTGFVDRLASGVDLMIDFATLGEYGLVPVCRQMGRASGAGREGAAHAARARREAGWEALAPARRGSCQVPPLDVHALPRWARRPRV